MDAGNMLKPALARGELHCVGATTLDEYRKYIEKDAALERRFQKILVGEPTVEAVLAERLGDLGVPVLMGLPFGHGRKNLAVPLGARVELDCERKAKQAEACIKARKEQIAAKEDAWRTAMQSAANAT
jgi:hypothetical protein